MFLVLSAFLFTLISAQIKGMCLIKNRFKIVNGISIPLELTRNVNAALKFAIPKVRLTSQGVQVDCLNAHNQYRALLGKRPLTWSYAATSVAQNWANNLASSGTFEHSHTPGYGENLYQNIGGDKSCNAAVTSWFNEYDLFSSGNTIDSPNFHEFGHFTQLIWDGTTAVGCAQADGQWHVTVCEYVPPGNVSGQKLYYALPVY